MKQRICRYFFNGNHIVNACISLVYWGNLKKTIEKNRYFMRDFVKKL